MEQYNREEREALERLVAYRCCAFKAGFRRSIRGNLWRNWSEVQVDGRKVVVTLTIYANGWGRYGFCVANEAGPRFSGACYETEEEALEALALVCLGGVRRCQ